MLYDIELLLVYAFVRKVKGVLTAMVSCHSIHRQELPFIVNVTNWCYSPIKKKKLIDATDGRSWILDMATNEVENPKLSLWIL